MQDPRWEKAAVELLTEVTILEPLIRSRIETAKPEGLSDTDLTVLMILKRQMGLPITQTALLWMMGEEHPGAVEDIDRAVDAGLISVKALEASDGNDGDRNLLLTPRGMKKCESAIQSLLPKFEPALLDVPFEAIEQAMTTLREIRRTLENLPD